MNILFLGIFANLFWFGTGCQGAELQTTTYCGVGVDAIVFLDIAETTWAGQDGDTATTFRFEKNGRLSYSCGNTEFHNGTWKQRGESIYFEMNKKYREFKGIVGDGQIEGDSWNSAGVKWKTSMTRSSK